MAVYVCLCACVRCVDCWSLVKAMIRYRDDLGRESVRVCGTCGKGAGEVLKRCANCTEVYCSRECQRQDWIGGHKLACKALAHIYDICECGKCL